jgi:hypothetical protein
LLHLEGDRSRPLDPHRLPTPTNRFPRAGAPEGGIG